MLIDYLNIILITILLQMNFALSPQVDFINQKFMGKWNSQNHIFHKFSRLSGNLQISFKSNSQLALQRPIVNQIQILLLDPIYHDARSAKLLIPLGMYNKNQQKWINESSIVRISILQKKQQIQSAVCQGNVTVVMTKISQIMNQNEFELVIKIYNNENLLCYLSLQSNLQYYNQVNYIFKKSKKLMYYCSFMVGIYIFQIFNIIQILKKHQQNTLKFQIISLTTVWATSIQDFFIGLIHLYYIYQQKNYYTYFILPIILIFLQVVLDYKFIIQVFLSHQKNSNPILIKKKLIIFHIKIVLVLIGYIIIMYLFPYEMATILCQGITIFPQIIKNSIRKAKWKWHNNYVIGFLLMRSILPLYYRGCPSNFYYTQPSYTFCVLWLSIYIFQFGVMYLQTRLGGKFYLPRCLQYQESEYFILSENNIPQQKVCLQIKMKECSICLLQIKCSINEQIIMAKCKHLFHQKCITQWLKIKLECPICRSKLNDLSFNN